MRKIRTHREFINESVRDLMKPKSEDEVLSKLDSSSPRRLLIKSCKIDYLNGVKIALEKGVDPSFFDNYAILISAEFGHIDIVKLLLQDKRVRAKLTEEEIKKYENQIKGLNESVRNLMKPKTENELRDIIKLKMDINKDYIEVKIPEPKELKKVKSLLRFSDEYHLDIKDYDDNNILICGDIIDVFNFMEIYLNYALLNKRNSKDFYVDYILKNSVNSLTESVRDLMKGKTEDEISSRLSKMSKRRRVDKLIKFGMSDRLSDKELKDYVLKQKTEDDKIHLIGELRVDHLFTDEELINILRKPSISYDELIYGLVNNRINIIKDALKYKRRWFMGQYFFPMYRLYSMDEIQFAALSGYKDIVKLLIEYNYHAHDLIPVKGNMLFNNTYYKLTDVLDKIGYNDIKDIIIENDAIISHNIDSSSTIEEYFPPK